jgi:hypothetical protein
LAKNGIGISILYHWHPEPLKGALQVGRSEGSMPVQNVLLPLGNFFGIRHTKKNDLKQVLL